MSEDVFLKFDPRQPRAKNGEWSKVPGTSGQAKGLATRSATQSPESVRAGAAAGGGHPADAVVDDQAEQMAAETRATGKEHGMLVAGDGEVLGEVQGQKSCCAVQPGVAYQMRNVEGKEAYSVTERGKLTEVHTHPEGTGPSSADLAIYATETKFVRAMTVVSSHGDVIRVEPGSSVQGAANTHKRFLKSTQMDINSDYLSGKFGNVTEGGPGKGGKAKGATEVARHEAFVVGTHAAIVAVHSTGQVKVNIKVSDTTKAMVQRVKATNPSFYKGLMGDKVRAAWKDFGYDPD